MKTSTLVDANANGRADAGELISYGFAVTNSGNQTIAAITVQDPSLTQSLVGSIASLAPGASQSFTRTAPITQANLDALAAGSRTPPPPQV